MNASTRNKPCPCGSGKKEKRCCFDGVRLQREANAREEEARIKAYAEWVANGKPCYQGSGIPNTERPKMKLPLVMLAALACGGL